MINNQYEVLSKSIISDYKNGIPVDSIIKSIGDNFLKRTERKQFVFNVIYDYLMLKKKESKALAN